MTTTHPNLITLNKAQIEALADEFLAAVGQYLGGATGAAFTPAELRSALGLALRDLQSARAILFFSLQRGLETAPLRLLERWSARLGELAEAPAQRPATLRNALTNAARQQCGALGGSLLVWREQGGVIIHVLANINEVTE